MNTVQAIDLSGVLATSRALISQLGSSSAPSIAIKFTVVSTRKTYVGTRTILRKEISNSDIGKNSNYVFSVLADQSQFTAQNPAPQPKDRVTIGDTTYKVLASESDAIGATMRIHLGSEYSR